MLSCRNLSMSFGATPLFSAVSLDVARRERVALLGPNGGGKSTLLKIVAGELQPTTGQIDWASAVEVGYLPQVEWESEARSAGQRQKGRLADVLGPRPNFLVLDEPTNHLDRDAIRWIVDEIAHYPGAVLMACHDRQVVAELATRVLYLERGTLRSYPGGYSAFLKARDEEERIGRQHHAAWVREHERLEASAVRQRNWAEKAHRDAGERNPYGKKRAAKMMQRALAAETRIARHEAIRVDKPWESPPLSFRFLPVKRLPPVLGRVDEGAFTYAGPRGRTVGPVSFVVRRGERLLLDGPNGAGKTTILHWLSDVAGMPRLAQGTRRGQVSVHPGAVVRLFDPAAPLNLRATPVQLMLAAGAPDAALARTLLGHFAIQGDLGVSPAETLSPGEQVRLRAACLLVEGADILLLDEPTNHLDLEGQKALEDALRVYPGTVVLASHDQAFRAAVATRAVSIVPSGRPEPQESTRKATEPSREALLEMRLALLTSRLDAAARPDREGIERALDEVVSELRDLRQPRRASKREDRSRGPSSDGSPD